jgi:hypothetical protein
MTFPDNGQAPENLLLSLHIVLLVYSNIITQGKVGEHAIVKLPHHGKHVKDCRNACAETKVISRISSSSRNERHAMYFKMA